MTPRESLRKCPSVLISGSLLPGLCDTSRRSTNTATTTTNDTVVIQTMMRRNRGPRDKSEHWKVPAPEGAGTQGQLRWRWVPPVWGDPGAPRARGSSPYGDATSTKPCIPEFTRPPPSWALPSAAGPNPPSPETALGLEGLPRSPKASRNLPRKAYACLPPEKSVKQPCRIVAVQVDSRVVPYNGCC